MGDDTVLSSGEIRAEGLEQVYPIQAIASLASGVIPNTPETVEALGLEITRSLESVFHSYIRAYHAWITPYAVNVDFLIISDFPSLRFQGRCYTSIDKRIPGSFSTGCTIIPFMDGKRLTKTGDRFPSTIYLYLEMMAKEMYWSYGKRLEGYTEAWDTQSPVEVKAGQYTREIIEFY